MHNTQNMSEKFTPFILLSGNNDIRKELENLNNCLQKMALLHLQMALLYNGDIKEVIDTKLKISYHLIDRLKICASMSIK